MISPKFSLTHYSYNAKTLSSLNSTTAPHIVNLYLDYNCPFSAKLYLKFKSSVVPELNKKHPGLFQFVFVNVVQPWHLNSIFLNEYSIVFAKILREKGIDNSNELFWNVSEVLFANKESFYDTFNVSLNRNEIYQQINDLVFDKLSIPFDKKEVLKGLTIDSNESNPNNEGNDATADIKYFTKYLRGVGVHVTPTVSVDGIANGNISSGSEPEELIKILESSL
ncbi:hypothetical protein HYPBUDRAFT_153889 [Hyphopichia burtonii NRRL Y-1933]|uniref:Uncharacterized protein n=1 Tax=Hyphopichia burtonii NRRL Y-1933 TaxID=984485 RepID=A0A1E4REP7_9ASCO|nr:hypothetical protein HYPBUDRAFT_153889 [Hyphopichia burtonii NRRL Y-1933]ODV65713.1 hypothetical protein HYPBUDRAFT_153889 [Hyphopichia burtonii NRRL Y-1933]